MSLWDSVLSNTVGVAFRAYSGNVDPWTLQVQKDEAAAAVKKALGPDATPEAIAAAQSAAESEIDVFLKNTDSHPDQAGLRLPVIGVLDLPKLNRLVNGALLLLALGGAVYFGLLYHKTLAREYQKLKKGK